MKQFITFLLIFLSFGSQASWNSREHVYIQLSTFLDFKIPEMEKALDKQDNDSELCLLIGDYYASLTLTKDYFMGDEEVFGAETPLEFDPLRSEYRAASQYFGNTYGLLKGFKGCLSGNINRIDFRKALMYSKDALENLMTHK